MDFKQGWDIPFRYVFSGNLVNDMKTFIEFSPIFEPLDMLETQLNRSSLKKLIEWKKEGFARWIFCDSGAFSVHTGKADTTEDEYIEYINTIIDDVDIFAQLDTIPGKFGKPKSKEDYIESANKSWDNFIYTRNKIKDKNKVMPIFHFGEDIQFLDRMLDYRDEDGDKLEYIGLSPANDASVKDRMKYLDNMYDHIHKSSNPTVKTHVYGFTSLEAMSKFPCYSADSITHRLLAGYNKIFTKNFGIISVSDRPKSNKIKSNSSFLFEADEYNLNKLRDEFTEKGYDIEFAKSNGFEGDDILDWLPYCNNLRVAFNIITIQQLINNDYKYHEKNNLKQKRLI